MDINPQKQGLYEVRCSSIPAYLNDTHILQQVIHTDTGLSVILHLSQMKPIDSARQTHDKFNLGADIAYYDNCLAEWLSGTIKVNDIQS